MKTITIELDAETFTKFQLIASEEERTVEGHLKTLVRDELKFKEREQAQKNMLERLRTAISEGEPSANFTNLFKQ